MARSLNSLFFYCKFSWIILKTLRKLSSSGLACGVLNASLTTRLEKLAIFSYVLFRRLTSSG